MNKFSQIKRKLEIVECENGSMYLKDEKGDVFLEIDRIIYDREHTTKMEGKWLKTTLGKGVVITIKGKQLKD